MKRYVPDTSVVVKWFSLHGEESLKQALLLRDSILRGECSITVPSLLIYELANALRFNPNLSVTDVRDAASSVLDMELDVLEASAQIVNQAVEIAYAYDITVYDACFFATARLRQARFITADKRLYERTGRSEDVLLLENWGAG